jgi:hypothetical protein
MTEQLRAEAQDPSTPPERLAQLSKDPELAHWLAQNPNVPREELLALAQVAPDSLARNPALALWALEPEWLYALPHAQLIDLLRVPGLPAALLAALSGRSDEAGLSYLAAYPGLPEELLWGLAARGLLTIHVSLAENPSTPPALLESLLDDPPPLPAPSLHERIKLWIPGVSLVQKAVDVLRGLPHEVAKVYRSHSIQKKRLALARHPKSPPSVLARLSLLPDASIQAVLASRR